MTAATRESRRAQIRAMTAARHQALHAQSPFLDIHRGAFGPEDVNMMEDLHSQCWSAYAHPGNDAAFIAAAGLAPRDLFGIEGAQAGAPRPVSATRACGAAYVYLGSKFGGALLSRRLEAAGFHRAADRLRQSDADRTAWRRLLSRLDLLNETDFSEACEEANYAFDAFRLPQPAR